MFMKVRSVHSPQLYALESEGRAVTTHLRGRLVLDGYTIEIEVEDA